MGSIYNIPASLSAVDVLAEKFLAEYAQEPLALADVLFLLPNRRAAKALADAFVRAERADADAAAENGSHRRRGRRRAVSDRI